MNIYFFKVLICFFFLFFFFSSCLVYLLRMLTVLRNLSLFTYLQFSFVLLLLLLTDILSFKFLTFCLSYPLIFCLLFCLRQFHCSWFYFYMFSPHLFFSLSLLDDYLNCLYINRSCFFIFKFFFYPQKEFLL